MVFTLSVLDRKYFWGKFSPKKSKLSVLAKILYKFQLEYTELDGGFHFFVTDWNTFFWANLVQKTKVVGFSWNLVLIWICRIQWCCSLFLFKTGNTLFWANFVQTIKIVHLSGNLVLRLIRISKIHGRCSFFVFSSGSILFWGEIYSKKSKLLKLKLRT